MNIELKLLNKAFSLPSARALQMNPNCPEVGPIQVGGRSRGTSQDRLTLQVCRLLTPYAPWVQGPSFDTNLLSPRGLGKFPGLGPLAARVPGREGSPQSGFRLPRWSNLPPRRLAFLEKCVCLCACGGVGLGVCRAITSRVGSGH